LLCARESDQKKLAKNLDEICVMIFDMGLHDDTGMTAKIFDADFFLN
jgi:hypothetical protein